jgi:hypothetical protein
VSAEVGLLTSITVDVIASRGGRLTLTRLQSSGPDHPAIQLDVLQVVTYDADERIAAAAIFDPDDFDAAFAELDARYLAGEAACHAEVWSEIVQSYAAMNRHEIPQAMSNWETVDHRVRETFEGGDLTAYARSAWDLMPDVTIRIEAVHRLSDLGAVATHVAYGTSQDGFEAEWRMIVLLLKRGENLNRCELFNEADIGDALSRFEESNLQATRLKNQATQVQQRFWTYFADRDWDTMVELLADDICTHDRRRVVNAGVQHGRDVEIANMRALADVEANTALTVIATRGERLVLSRLYSSNQDLRHGEFGVELLNIVEVDADNRIATGALFDPEDVDAAFAELDARYLAGEASTYTRTWSVVTRAYTTLNSRQIPAATPDCINIDHRRGIAYEGDVVPYLNATWDISPDITMRIEAVHRLTDLGAVVTWASFGTSQKGFSAEWQGVNILTVQGDLISHGEIFDEADLDAALARFDELSRPAS